MDSADQMTLSGAGLNAAALERLLQSDEPDWLKDRRRSAWQAYEQLPPPGWRYMEADRFPLGEVVPFVESDPSAALAQAPAEIRAVSEGGRSAAGLVIQADNSVKVAHLRDDLRARGVILTDMATAVREHGDLVQKYLFAHGPQPEEHRFLALHAALWTGGFFFYVPKDVEVNEPVYFLQALTQAGAGRPAPQPGRHRPGRRAPPSSRSRSRSPWASGPTPGSTPRCTSWRQRRNPVLPGGPLGP